MCLKFSVFNEKKESTVFSSSSKLICFSISDAPKVTAAIGTEVPRVWSDSPTKVLNFFFNAGIVFKFCSVIGDGYDDTQCKIIIFLQTFFFRTFNANFNSLKDA